MLYKIMHIKSERERVHVSLWAYIYLEICVNPTLSLMFAKCHITFYSSNVCYYLKLKIFEPSELYQSHTKLWKTLYNLVIQIS